MAKRKKKVDMSDIERGTFPTGYLILDSLTGKDMYINPDKPDEYVKVRGLRSGTMVGCFANPNMGKTTLEYNIMGRMASKYFYKDVEGTIPEIHIYDAEDSVDLSWVCACTGFPYNRDIKHHVRVYPRKDATTERMYDAFKAICDEKDKNAKKYKSEVRLCNGEMATRYLPTYFMVDSISSLTPQKLKDKDKVEQTYAMHRAQRNNNYLEKMKMLASEYNIMIFVIQHQVPSFNVNMFAKRERRSFGSSTNMTGGTKIQFETDVQLWIDRLYAYNADKVAERYKNSSDLNIISLLRCIITKNRYGSATSNTHFSLVQTKEHGFDPLHSYIYHVAYQLDIMKSKGAYRSLDGYDNSFYTADIEKLLRTDESFREALSENVNRYYHKFIEYHDTDEVFNKTQSIIDDLL